MMYTVVLPWWRHQMETISEQLALCEENPPVTGGFPSQRPVTRNFDIFFDLNKRWANNRDDCGLRRHCAHYDVAVMPQLHFIALHNVENVTQLNMVSGFRLKFEIFLREFRCREIGVYIEVERTGTWTT